MPQIKQNLTTRNRNIGRSGHDIEYIVLHYTYGSQTAAGAAYANTQYFKSAYRGASAHYFIDDGDIIWQSVRDEDTAWSVGSRTGYKHPRCRNYNSISIEVCTKGAYTAKEIQNASWLVQNLQKQHGIADENVIRHYDVTGKYCPAHYLDGFKWAALKAQLLGKVPTDSNEQKPANKSKFNPSEPGTYKNVSDGWQHYQNKTYYVSKGELLKGFQTIKEHLYYFDTKTGEMYHSGSFIFTADAWGEMLLNKVN
ncbi:MAG: N-acetylmuramoyl-L-alanine amidase [Coriobacteriia bacterium]|nr:N-acetylmuramoyl-L-alanine amidase [Coriobacteriia bacterium]